MVKFEGLSGIYVQGIISGIHHIFGIPKKQAKKALAMALQYERARQAILDTIEDNNLYIPEQEEEK